MIELQEQIDQELAEMLKEIDWIEGRYLDDPEGRKDPEYIKLMEWAEKVRQ